MATEAAGQVPVDHENIDLKIKIGSRCRLEFKSGRDCSSSSRRERSSAAGTIPQHESISNGLKFYRRRSDGRTAAASD
jgi:hypothetical protein